MKHSATPSILLAFLVAGCGGGGGGGSVPVTGAANSAAASNVGREAQADAAYAPQAAHVPASSDLLYISNAGNRSITVYHHDAQGDAAPTAVISGSRTRLTNPGALSEDAAGNLYVANNPAGTSTAPSVLVFAHGANGNVAPIRVLGGPATQIFYAIGGIAVDQTTGKLFVVTVNIPFTGGTAILLRFAPNAAGNTAPFAGGPVTFFGTEIAADSTGRNVIEPFSGCCNAADTGVDTYVKQFPNGAAPTNVYDIRYLQTNGGVADDATTKTYLLTGGRSIYRLAEDTVGEGPLASPSVLKPAIVSTITTSAYCGQLALGYLRNIYALCGDGVDVYAHDATGKTAPLRVLSGPGTKLNGPNGIYEGK